VGRTITPVWHVAVSQCRWLYHLLLGGTLRVLGR
jgi:hypothetical protein